jgi:hypothetical protein
MGKELFGVKIYVSDKGFICISQEEYGFDDRCIILHPSQINLIIKWLKELKSETKTNKGDK